MTGVTKESQFYTDRKKRGYILSQLYQSINPQRNGRRSLGTPKPDGLPDGRDRCYKKSPFPVSKGLKTAATTTTKKSFGRQPKKGGVAHWPSIASARCVQVEYTGGKKYKK
ncbi:hypothetical protein CEXT_262741 [Caerostris extrusa]|uniref:Uncharacterized protein n=1 Tax=Caerostris extrusa TaxID=172846 RepID=A0AAV4WE63_CAEEX|nr:hypothetical protein CEXT_262741 [Caerostris extrusa]